RSTDGIIRPGMLRIATLHLGFDRRPGAPPKARQIARDLNWPVRGREQMQRQWQPPARNRRMPVEAEQLLHPDVQGGGIGATVINRVAVAGRRHEMCRRLGIQPTTELPRQKPIERGAEVVGGELVKTSLALDERSHTFPPYLRH